MFQDGDATPKKMVAKCTGSSHNAIFGAEKKSHYPNFAQYTFFLFALVE